MTLVDRLRNPMKKWWGSFWQMDSRLNLKGKIKSFDQLFESTLSENKTEDIISIEIEKLEPFPEHPFKRYTGSKLDNLVESIKNYGIMTPVTVRGSGEKYQILSGHNRVNAARIAGLIAVPCVLRDVDDDTAAIIVVESNFRQRDEMLPNLKNRCGGFAA